MELRALFGPDPWAGTGLEPPVGDVRCLVSRRALDPGRSPFLKYRLAVEFTAATLEELAEQAAALELGDGVSTFKVRYVEAVRGAADYAEQRAIERAVGARVRGTADMRAPELLLGVARLGSRWVLGGCAESGAAWLAHQHKPRQYSTALSTRVARAVANIAVPEPAGVRAVDPCCGIGTVLVEALSMGIDIVGYDINPLAVTGARANLAHFGMEAPVAIADMRGLDGRYDAAVLDMPYNLCSVLPPDEQAEMLASLRRLAGRAVIVTAEPIDEAIGAAGFTVADRCDVRKGRFVRQIILCT
ncbi:TRM11 family SAM-dependent methyltransferase [Paenibacillus gansuensis]|uniref:TRM11 family SAM-dependent methyltransferase n=1 Tax=Paenibacillus gansuensis TaxID=306542 RepID=A0ABW5PGE9_9BACL